MIQQMVKIIQKGDKNGNNMPIRIKLPSDLEVIGLPTENAYGGEWDLGPTWNYLVLADKPFLVDTGRFGMGHKLMDMMESVGISASDLEFVILSHGHEDHDGGLSDIVRSAGVKVKGHYIYQRLIRLYPTKAPTDARKNFPASCWHCLMPDSFSTKHCLSYHQARSKLDIEEIEEGNYKIGEDIFTHHIPGHSPDSLAIVLGQDAIIVGDTILPDITPHPTTERLFNLVDGILGPQYKSPQSIFGLRAYIKSLKMLKEMGQNSPNIIVLPAHRLFYNNHWNDMNLQARVDELIEHHIERCSDILKILKQGPKTPKEIAVEHFEEPLLRGSGILMAENEITSHCELLMASHDVFEEKDLLFTASGSSNFISTIPSQEPV